MAIKGTILGDIIGSQYEFKRPENFNYKTAVLLSKNCKFTDDTVLSVATKYAVENEINFSTAYKLFGLKYPHVGYGDRFRDWLYEDSKPYGSCGNGSAMRVSYIADYFDNKDDVIKFATESAECTHNHIEGIKGAVTTAVCIWMAKHSYSKEEILCYSNKQYPKERCAFSSELSLDEIRNIYRWNETCQGSVPVAIRCVYEANNYTEFIRNVFSLNCDTDTLCAIGGGIAEELFDNTYDEIFPFCDKVFEKYLDDYLIGLLNNKI